MLLGCLEFICQYRIENKGLTCCHVLGDVKRVGRSGELGHVVVDVLDGDVQPHVGRLLPVVGSHQEGVFRPPLPVQLLGGDQVAGFGVDPEAVVRPADDGVGHESVRTLRGRQKIGHVCIWAAKPSKKSKSALTLCHGTQSNG